MKSDNRPTLRVLGIRGLPAAHGGFETFAEHFCLHLTQKGWRVVVYCQEEGDAPVRSDIWRGIERVFISVPQSGVFSSVIFDWKSITHAMQTKDLCLTLGYNTAIFCARLRIRQIPNVINMDGIEWSRAKWGRVAKTWFWLNDWAGCWLGNHLIADHPEIKTHLTSRVREEKITTIAYGADPIGNVSDEPVKAMGLTPGRFMTVIARPEPENSILEVVEGYCSRHRDVDLVVLGNYDSSNPYHQKVISAGAGKVKFVGAIYDKEVVHALRCHSLLYIHGHQVGGTNPSLVEALGAGNAVIAHDNKFNRWVAADGARFFNGANEFDSVLTELLRDPDAIESMRHASKARFESHFTWNKILGDYERLMTAYLPAEQAALTSTAS